MSEDNHHTQSPKVLGASWLHSGKGLDQDINNPSIDELSRINKELHLNCSEEDIETIQGQFEAINASIRRVSSMEQSILKPQENRSKGSKPIQRENPCNGWAWRCDIKETTSGKLAGKTIGIKDNIAVRGVPMQNGSKLMEGYIPECDATVVSRVLHAGGNIIGKTNCESLCYDASSFLCCNGHVTNPHDMSRSSGGSSSGNGALVAAGAVDMAIGGDQGGSIRVPASWCGIVGLKPTHGLVPYTGAMPLEVSMDHLGPMARTVTDCALLLEVIAGYDDGKDPRQNVSITSKEYTRELDHAIAGKKVGVLREGMKACSERDVVDVVRRAVDRLRGEGAAVEEVSVPQHTYGPDVSCLVNAQGGYHGLFKSRHTWGNGFYSLSSQKALCNGLKKNPDELTDILKCYYVIGEYLDRAYDNELYSMAQSAALTLRKAYDVALDHYDVLVMPTTTHKASKLPTEKIPLKGQMEKATTMEANTCPFNITGHPALSINAGFSEGLPVGLMIVGRHFHETTVLQVARAFERVRDRNM